MSSAAGAVERTPRQACEAILADLAAGGSGLVEVHSRLRAVKRRPNITTAAVLAQVPAAAGIDHADAAALVGASASAAFTGLTPEQVTLLDRVVISGGMRLPYPGFPWSPPPRQRQDPATTETQAPAPARVGSQPVAAPTGAPF